MSKGGRCESCAGDGTIKIEMHFLPDVYVPCEICKGSRYNRDTLDILFKGKTIADVLNMPAEEALEFFCEPAADRSSYADARRRGTGICAARAVGADALRRRGPARKAGQRAGQAQHRPHDLHPRRTHNWVCTSKTSASFSMC